MKRACLIWIFFFRFFEQVACVKQFAWGRSHEECLLGGGSRMQVRFLLETAGVTEANVGKVIALQPRLIGCSMSNKLQPLVEYFLNHQLRRDQLGTMVADFPMLLKYNVSIIKPKLEYFKRVLALPFDDLIAFPR